VGRWSYYSKCSIYNSFSYKLITDPSIVVSWFKATTANVDPNANNPTTQIIPSSPGSSTGSITPTSTTKSLITLIGNNIKKLSPLYWLTSSVDTETQANLFAIQQHSGIDHNPAYYPFTKVNPYAPWYEKLRISWLGENTSERTARHILKREYYSIMFASTSCASESLTSVATASTSILSPSIGTVGLGTADPYYS